MPVGTEKEYPIEAACRGSKFCMLEVVMDKSDETTFFLYWY